MLRNWFIFILSILIGQAQSVFFKNLSLEDGLIQSEVNCIAQDSTGRIWAGTNGGISRYNSHNFTSITTMDGLSSRQVFDLFISNEGTYTITAKGIDLILPDTIIPIMEKNMAYYSTLFFAHNTLSYFDGQEAIYSLPDNRIIYRDIAWVDRKSNTMISKKGYIMNFSGDSLFHFNQGHTITSFSKYDSSWLISTEYGSYHGNKKVTDINDELKLYHYQTDDEGYLWAGGGFAGLLRIGLEKGYYYDNSKGFTDNISSCLLKDLNGNIWIGTLGNGLFIFGSDLLEYFTPESFGLKLSSTSSITKDESGNFWVGYFPGGIERFDGSQLTYYTYHSNSVMKSDITYELLSDKNQGVWSMTGNGVDLFKNDDIIHYDIGDLRTPALCGEFFNSTLLTGSPNGIFKFDDSANAFIPYSIPEIDSLYVHDLSSASQNELYIASSSGVFRYHPASGLKVLDSFCNSHLVRVFSNQNYVYAGESPGFKWCFNGHNYNVSRKNGLESDLIKDIMYINDTALWVGSSQGISLVTLSEKAVIVNKLTKENGYTGGEPRYKSFFKETDSVFYVATTKGIIRINGFPKDKNVRTPVFIESVFTGKNSYNGALPAEIPFSENSLSINLIFADYLKTPKINYYLEGPTKLQGTLESHLLQLSNLSPGAYSLWLSQHQERYLLKSFVITTPFWKKKVFIFLVVVSLLILILLLNRLYTSWHSQRLLTFEKEKQQQINELRKTIAQDFHDEMGNYLASIRYYVDVLKHKPGSEGAEFLERMQKVVNKLFYGSRDFIWAINPANDDYLEVFLYLKDFADDLFSGTDIRFISAFEGDHSTNHPTLGKSRQLVMIGKELFTNTLKHSMATECKLEISVSKNYISMEIKDNGKGFKSKKVTHSGLRNIIERANKISFKMDMKTDKGTSIKIFKEE